MNTYIREPLNSLTHFIGAILSFFALLAMLIKTATTTPTPVAITAVTVFGVSMILLYSTSAIYHMVVAKDKVIAFLRRLDHSMIFVMIAGSYTPFCLIALDNAYGIGLFIAVVSVGIAGVVFKMVWFNCPRWLSTFIYIAMGWMAIFIAGPMMQVLSPQGLFYMVLGGVLYTIGGVIYGIKPKFLKFKHVGYHEIFHIFIMLGSIAHFICVFKYVL